MTYDEACAAVCAPGTMFEILETEVRGVPTKVFAGAPPNITALCSSSRQLAKASSSSTRTNAGPCRRCSNWPAKIGHALVETWGVSKGDRVSLAMRNYPEWIAAYAAIVSIGAVAVPLNAWWLADELQFAIEDSGSSVVLADKRAPRPDPRSR